MVPSLAPSRIPGRNLALVALLALATCNEQVDPAERVSLNAARKKLGTVPPTEHAAWRRAVSATAPEGRYLQAVAFDEARQAIVMFGGENRALNGASAVPTQDLWEWSVVTRSWTLRTASGPVPEARAGAAMVFDPGRNKMLLSGGRAASGYNYEDLWEWDPSTGVWTERSQAGTHPSARAQHAMVYQTSTGKVLLFGGGRSSASVLDGVAVSTSLGDTWELEPATGVWTLLAPTSSPGVRHDFGLAWDSLRNKAVLFGGMQIDIPGATGVPKQDTWEWDPGTASWTERTLAGSKPSQRYGHAMAFDGDSGKVVLYGGWDMVTTGSKSDLWEWDATTGAWTQLLGGTEPGLPQSRTFASMVHDPAGGRMVLVAGQVLYSDSTTGLRGLVGSNEVWELDPGTSVFTDRTTAYRAPSARSYHAMAYDPLTSQSYVFGGVDPLRKGAELVDLWAWDGALWTQISSDGGPTGRIDAAMAQDPVRGSLILFGGNSWQGGGITPNDTWEWSKATGKWTQLTTNGAPPARWGHAMVTDPVRGKILLFGGSTKVAGEVWEWDGRTLTWTDRTPLSSSSVPVIRNYPVVSFDQARGKLLVYDGSRSPSLPDQSNSAFWEWDVATGGWELRDPGDKLPDSVNVYAAYDAIRRRHVFLTDAKVNNVTQTWELDATTATWYVRSLDASPGNRFRSAMTWDAARGVVVLFGGSLNETPGGTANDVWEYAVTSLANGEGCTAGGAATCASGFCVEGVCCEVAGCTGACKSCNVAGSEGTCVAALPGTEVPGSCADGQACDGTGTCKGKNGQACTSAAGCASGFCVDGVCCSGACTAPCTACNLAGRVGTCTAFAAGSDPDGECGRGTAPCTSTCDGVGACTFPLGGVVCGACLTCDGAGTCSRPDPACSAGGTGGSVPGKGGNGGSGGKVVPASGGSGGMANGGSGGSASGGKGGSASGGSGGMANGGSGGSASGGSGGSASGGVRGDGSAGSGGTLRDAGVTTSIGGAVGASGGSSGTTLDGAATNLDARSGSDAGLTAKLQRGGCSCSMGEGDVTEPWLSWVILIGVVGLVSRARGSRVRRASGRCSW